MRWPLVVLWILSIGCGPSFADDVEDRSCAEVMLDSLGEPYPTGGRETCFPGVGDDTPTGSYGLGGCGDDEPGVVFAWGRFFQACPSCNSEHSGGFVPADCRPLVCETDSDCPAFASRGASGITTETFECRNSLCQNADVERYPVDVVLRSDALLLCLADVAREGDAYEGDPVCPDVDDPASCPLPLPDACMQP